MTADAGTAASGPPAEPDLDAARLVLYERVCESYHAVDDFRMKLLGLLPVATGTGVFLLLSGKAELVGNDRQEVSDALLAIGIFGLLFTCGLFAYELFGIKKCHYLIVAGKRLEAAMEDSGQFRSRARELAGFINEPFASAVIYPASMAAWSFLALALRSSLAAGLVAGAVFVVGYKVTRLGARRIKENQENEELVLSLVRNQGPMTPNDVREQLGQAPVSVEPATNWRDAARAAIGRQHDWVALVVRRLEQQGDVERTKRNGDGTALVQLAARRRTAGAGRSPPAGSRLSTEPLALLQARRQTNARSSTAWPCWCCRRGQLEPSSTCRISCTSLAPRACEVCSAPCHLRTRA
jgi:hypothetical protein